MSVTSMFSHSARNKNSLGAAAQKAVRSALAPVCAIEPLESRRMMSATLSLTNPYQQPSNNRLIFNVIQNPDTTTPNVVHSQQTLVINNTGDAPLVVSSMAINGPWAFVGAPAGGYVNQSIAVGSSLTVTLAFTQTTLPAHSYNETNYTTNPNGGAAISGSLTINSNDPNNPTTQVALAGYWQNQSNNNDEPSLQTIVNLLGGYKTVINSTPIPDLTENSGVQYYGDEVAAVSWESANPTQPVKMQELASYRTEGNNSDVYWYTAQGQASTQLISDPGDQAQSVLPTLANGSLAAASFNPVGAFGIRIDNEYSTDSINSAAGNTGGGGHHMRFFPLIDPSGNTIPNSYIVAVDYGTLQTENFDFQDNVFIITNVRPSTVPETPSNLTATNGVNPTLTWTADNYSPVSYNVYSSTTQTGTFTLLTSTPITTTTFTDTTNAGTPVYYQVVAVDTTQSPVAASVPATTSANTGPVVSTYNFSIFTNGTLTFNPLANATDKSGTIVPSTVTITAPLHGVATAHSDGTITYTANSTFVGNDSFTYTVTDTNGATSAPGTITFAVSAPVVVTPVANNEVVTDLANTPININVMTADLPVTAFNTASIVITSPVTLGSTSYNASTGIITYTPSTNIVGGDTFTYTIMDNNGQVSNPAIVDINIGTEISSLKGAPAKSLLYTDENGTKVTVGINKGVADVFFDGTGTIVSTVKGKTTVAGSNLRARNINLTGTTTASVLSISGAKGAQFNLGGVTDASPLGAINAPGADLRAIGNSSLIAAGNTISPLDIQTATPIPAAGTIQLAGVKSISLRNANTADFILGASGVASTTLSFVGSVTDTDVSATVPLATVKATKWIKSNTDIEQIVAPSINNLQIAGEFDPALSLATTTRAISLNNAKIGGLVSIGSWNITGNAHAISVGSASASWGGLNVTGNIGSFVVAHSGLSSSTIAGSINTMKVAGILSGNVTTTGNLLTLQAVQLANATIDVGNTVSSVSAATSANIGTATLRSLVLTGKTANTFSNSNVIASVINSFSTGPVNAAATTAEGVAAHTIKGASVNVDGGVLHLNAKTLLNEAALQAFLTKGGRTLGTFSIDLLDIQSA